MPSASDKLQTVIRPSLCMLPILLLGCPANSTPDQQPVTALTGDENHQDTSKPDSQEIARPEKTPSTDSPQGIHIPDSAGWKTVTSTPGSTVWAGRPGNTYTLATHSGKPSVPLDDVNALRDHVRKLAAAEQGGLVQADIIQVNEHTAAYFITKDTIPKSMGYRYVGRCVIPFDGGWHEFRMDATAVGPTWKREAFLGVKLKLYTNAKMEEIPPEAPPIPGSRKGKPTGKRVKGLIKDPYDTRFDASANYWITDDAKFDSQFPQHELSRLRSRFPKIIDSIKIR